MMVKKALLTTTAAAVTLLASGVAKAADIPPMIVPVVVAPPPVVVSGPVYAITVDTAVSTGSSGGFEISNAAAVDVLLPSGWGFKLAVETGLDLNSPAPAEGDVAALGRVYRAIGDATVGVFVSNNFFWTFGVPGVGRTLTAGVDADYRSDTAEIDFLAAALFSGGTYLGALAALTSELDIRQHLRIETQAFAVAPPGGPAVLIAVGQVGYRIGPITPYILAGVAVTPTLNGGVAVGVDFEHQLNGGPLTLMAGASIGLLPDFSFELTGGFEYALGNDDGPLTLRGEVEYGTGGYWSATLGIGLKFGPGRVSGPSLGDFAL